MKTSFSSKHFAFIGGGGVGTVLLIYLAKTAKENKKSLKGCAFHLIDPKGFGNGGIAYGQCAPTHILNTLRNEMSPWDKDKFHEFLVKMGRPNDALASDLRIDYRSFLERELKEARRELEKLGAQCIDHLKTAYIQRNGEFFSVVDEKSILIHKDLHQLPATNIVLTVGYGPNHYFDSLQKYSSDGYIDSIYPCTQLNETLQKLSEKRDVVKVGVLGSAAALYDFVMSCPLSPDKVKLFIFSTVAKKGLEIRQVETEHELKWLELHTFKALPETASVKDIEKAIQAEFEYATQIKAGPSTWPAFLLMMNMSQVLSKMTEKVAIEFRKSHFFKEIKRLGGPTTRASSQKLALYKPAFITENIKPSQINFLPDEGFIISTQDQKYAVDCIVNVTGHGRHTPAILEKMKLDKLAYIDPKLEVLATDDSRFRLKGSNIACIGPATHFGTDGIETFAKPAENVAREILGKIA